MKLIVFNNNVGVYNILNPSQKSFEFSIGLCEDDTRTPIEVNGIKAKLVFSGEDKDMDDFFDPIENLGAIFTKCFEYANRVFSTINYKEQCLLFAKLYQENFDAMDAVMLKEHKIKTQRTIEALQKELNWNTILPELTSDDVIIAIQKRINAIKIMVNLREKKLSELKEDSESYAQQKEYLKSNLDEIERLQS